MSTLLLLVGCFLLGILARAFSGLAADDHQLGHTVPLWWRLLS